MDLIFLSTFMAAALTSFVSAKDKSYCRIITEKTLEYRKHCYMYSTYRHCKDACLQAVISKEYVDQDCPWGDYPNARRCYEINNLTSGRYCLRVKMDSKMQDNPANNNFVTGMNCCGECMKTKGTSPDKTEFFRQQYPELYKNETNHFSIKTITNFLGIGSKHSKGDKSNK